MSSPDLVSTKCLYLYIIFIHLSFTLSKAKEIKQKDIKFTKKTQI